MVPTPTLALALRAMLAGALKIVPVVGEVMLTVGVGLLTVTATEPDVVVPPLSSVAFAVRL